MASPEYLVLASLEKGRESSLHYLAESTLLHADAIRRVLSGLEEQGLIRVLREKVPQHILTSTGQHALENGLPEQILCIALEEKPLTMVEAKKCFTHDADAFSAALGLAKRSHWIEVKNEENTTILVITPLGKKSFAHSPLMKCLESISRGEKVSPDSSSLRDLLVRGLVGVKNRVQETVSLTSKGVEAKQAGYKKDSKTEIGLLTPDLLVSGKWKDVSFKRYDVTAGVDACYPGRIHPLQQVIHDVRRVMVTLGFQEMDGPLVESSFWNMDAMFIPQDHPARDIQDTFFIPGKAVLPDSALVKRVKAVHEHGGRTGSKGFGYEWDARVAMQLLLRTHTTATTFREFGKGITIPAKRFAIGRIYRNESGDATHLSEFNQVEGFIAGEGLTLRHLMGVITEFYSKMGLTKIKFKPTYNPYTEPSMEAKAFHPGLGKWIELINSGMFREESLRPFGINVPVIAWGFGLERLALFLHQKSSLKEITGPDVDLDFIRNYPGIQHGIMERKVNEHGEC
ncbi:MAG: phenylalanine--tRNA ligase subunit alpha [Candidatus Diapherotrites archaeon]